MFVTSQVVGVPGINEYRTVGSDVSQFFSAGKVTYVVQHQDGTVSVVSSLLEDVVDVVAKVFSLQRRVVVHFQSQFGGTGIGSVSPRVSLVGQGLGRYLICLG